MVPDEAIRPVRQEIRLLFDLCKMDYIKPEHLAETFAAASLSDAAEPTLANRASIWLFQGKKMAERGENELPTPLRPF